MRRVVATASALLTAAGLTVGLSTPAGATTTKVHLPFTTYSHMLVDEAHGHIYFTSNTSTVTITDLAGANAQTRSSLPGSLGLAMSPDGSAVYVASAGANEIAAIDTTTLTVTTPVTSLPCGPSSLAYAGDKLYFSYSCSAATGSIGSVDFSGAAPVVATGLNSDQWAGAPALASGSPSSPYLAAADTSAVDVYDVSTGAPSATPARRANDMSVCQNFEALAMTPDATAVAVACGAPYYISVMKTSDLTTIDTYGGSSPYPAGVAMSADSAVIAGGFSQNVPNVVAWPLGAPAQPIYSGTLDAGGQGFLPADGLRIGPSGNLYAVVPTSVYGDDFDLVVVHGAARFPTTLTAAAPATDARTHQLTVSGSLSTSSTTPITFPATLQASRVDLAGTHALANVTTTGSGSYSFQDSPPVGGMVKYVVTWTPPAGDAVHRAATATARVKVARAATNLSISTDRSSYHYGAKAHITAHLGSTYNSKVVAIYATPYGLSRRLLRKAQVGSNRDLTTTFTMTRRTKFTAVFAGDYRHAPATTTRAVVTHGKITSALYGWYGSSHGYKLYSSGTDPQMLARLFPHLSGVCLEFVAQRYTSGSWHTFSKACLQTDSNGYSAAQLYGTHAVGVPYRMRAPWAGNTTSASATGSWLPFKFTS
jgi:YVTN family beta-propeller protein